MIRTTLALLSAIFNGGNPDRRAFESDIPFAPPDGVQDALRWRIEQGHVRRRPKRVETLDGDYFTVLGLPLMTALDFLRRQGCLAQ